MDNPFLITDMGALGAIVISKQNISLQINNPGYFLEF